MIFGPPLFCKIPGYALDQLPIIMSFKEHNIRDILFSNYKYLCDYALYYYFSYQYIT